MTRSLQWVRIGGLEGHQADHIELLDSPGIIPAKQINQDAAMKLAICNDIGQASYDRVVVAAKMASHLNALHAERPLYLDMKAICLRYKFPFHELTGEALLSQSP